MNEKLNQWIEAWCAGSIKASAYWLNISEDDLIELLGYESINNDVSNKLEELFEMMYPSKTETEALSAVIDDMQIKLGGAADAAIDFLESLNIEINTKEN